MDPASDRRGRLDRHLRVVLAVSAAATLFNLLFLSLRPPTDGDSYEYAGLARNVLRYGEMITTHLRMYWVASAGVPALATLRATLWTVVMIPFQAILGTTPLVFALPAAIAYFLLGPSTYLCARRIFSPRVALAAAVATMLNPRVMWFCTIEDPGQPDILGMVLILAAINLVLRRRWIAGGLMTGVTVLFRLTALVLPLIVAVWLVVADRKSLRTRGPYLFAAATLLACSPHFIRTAVLFGNPFYMDQQEAMRAIDPRAPTQVNIFKVMFGYDDPEGQAERAAHASFPPTISERLMARTAMMRGNLSTFIGGLQNGLAFYPGIVELLTFTLFPFVLVGIGICWFDRDRCFVSIFIPATLVLFSAIMVGYEDRYLMPCLPFAMMLAFHAVETLAGRIPWLSLGRVFWVFALLEIAPQIGFESVTAFTGDRHSQYRELRSVCDWVKAETPANAVLMTTPFYSPQYFCDRMTVPPVLGDLDTFKKVAVRFKVDYLLFSPDWQGDRFPRLPFLTPVLRGGYSTLYRIDRGNPDFVDLGRDGAYMRGFETFGYFWKDRFWIRFFQEPAYALYHLTGDRWKGTFLGGGLFLMLWTLAYRLTGSSSRLHRAGMFALAVGVTMLTLYSIIQGIHGKFDLTPPAVSRYQLDHLLARTLAPVRTVGIAGTEAETRALADIFQSAGAGVKPITRALTPPGHGPEAVFIPVDDAGSWIVDLSSARGNAATVQRGEARLAAAEARLRQQGYTTELIEGGVMGFH